MTIFTRRRARARSNYPRGWTMTREVRLFLNERSALTRNAPVEIRGKSYGLVAGHPEKLGIYTAYMLGWVNGKQSKI